jgi:hypothetical protein
LDTVDFSGLVAEVALPHLTTAQGNKNLAGAAKNANQNSDWPKKIRQTKFLLPNKIPQTKILIRFNFHTCNFGRQQ